MTASCRKARCAAYDFLDSYAPGRHSYYQLADYGHLDVLIGKNAPIDVFPVENLMPWFGQAIDAGDGRLHYGRDWLRPWRRRLKLDWKIQRSEERKVKALIAAHALARKLAILLHRI